MTTKRSFWLYEKLSFTCLRCEQGCKNEKLVITKFPIFGKRQTLVFVVVRTGELKQNDVFASHV